MRSYRVSTEIPLRNKQLREDSKTWLKERYSPKQEASLWKQTTPPLSPYSSAQIETDMPNGYKLWVSQALIMHCVTQIFILMSKSGLNKIITHLFLKAGIKLGGRNTKRKGKFASVIYISMLFSYCKETRGEEWKLTESRKSCRWSSDTVSPWTPEPWLPASPGPAGAHPEQSHHRTCARLRLSDNAIKWLLVKQEDSHVAVNPNRAKPSQLSAELYCSHRDHMQPVSTIFAASP